MFFSLLEPFNTLLCVLQETMDGIGISQGEKKITIYVLEAKKLQKLHLNTTATVNVKSPINMQYFN